MIRLLLAIAILMVASTLSHAQPPTRRDIRISPLEPFSLELPEDLRIESAAASDSTTLVVWGTREPFREIAIPALRMQIVRNGVAIGSPSLLHSSLARPSRFVRVVSEGNGFNVFWYDIRPGDTGVWRQRVDLDGVRIGDESRVIDGRIIDMVTYDDLPRLTLLLREKASSVLLHPDGSIDSSGLEQTALAMPHIIDADSSMVSVEGDSVVFRSSFRNGVVTQRLALPDSADLRHTATIARDSARRIVLTWMIEDPDPTRYYITAEAAIVFLVMQSRIIDRSRYDSAMIVDTIGAASGSGCHDIAGFRSATRIQRAGGFMVALLLFTTIQCPNNPVGWTFWPAWYHVGNDAAYTRDTSLRPDRADEIPLTRLCSDTMSVVALLWGGDTIVLSTPIAPINIGASQVRPALMAREGKVYAIWQQGLITATFRTAHDTAAGTTLSVPAGKREYYSLGRLVENIVDAYPHVLSNGMIIDRFHGTYTWGSASTTHTLYAATNEGWRQVFSRSAGYVPNRRISYARDPNSGLIAGAVETVKDSLLFYTLDEQARSSAAFAHAAPVDKVLPIIPVDSNTTLLIGGSSLLKATAAGIDTITTLAAPDSGAIERFDRLYGEYFLRSLLSADRRSIKLERYSLNGTLQESTSIPLLYPATDLSIALDGGDSSIFLFSGSSHGVRMSHLRSNLSLLRGDVRVSVTEDEVHNPSGVVVGDSLHVGWEDNRLGNSDIFGFVLGAPFDGLSHVEPMPASSETRASRRRISIAGIRPNPAGDIASIEIVLTDASDVEVAIVDISGRMVRRATRHFEAGEARWDLDIRELAGGIYITTVRSGSCSDTRKLLVLGER